MFWGIWAFFNCFRLDNQLPIEMLHYPTEYMIKRKILCVLNIRETSGADLNILNDLIGRINSFHRRKVLELPSSNSKCKETLTQQEQKEITVEDLLYKPGDLWAFIFQTCGTSIIVICADESMNDIHCLYVCRMVKCLDPQSPIGWFGKVWHIPILRISYTVSIH